MTSTEIFNHAFDLREYFDFLGSIEKIKKAESINSIDSELKMLVHRTDYKPDFNITEEYRTKAIESVSKFLDSYKKKFDDNNIEIVLE